MAKKKTRLAARKYLTAQAKKKRDERRAANLATASNISNPISLAEDTAEPSHQSVEDMLRAWAGVFNTVRRRVRRCSSGRNFEVMLCDVKIRQRKMTEGKTIWSEEKVKELIDLYHQYNLLWDSRHPDFKNRAKKNEAIKEMGCLLNCESLEVERKIQVVLAQYRRTRLKLTNLKRAGATEEEMEKNLWYGYKLLRFLEERALPDKGTERDNYSSENPVVVLVDAAEFAELKEESEEIVEPEEDSEHTLSTSTLVPVPQQITYERRASKRSRSSFDSREDERFRIMANASNSAPPQKDEYFFFGEQLACKLRKMEPILRLETQHKINCLVFEAEMKIAQNSGYDN